MNRITIWDILTVITLLGIVCLGAGFGALMFSSTPLTLFPAEPTITQAVIVFSTSTQSVAPRRLPPTWTPTVTQGAAPSDVDRPQRPTSTLEATSTPYIAPTATPLPTFTPLPSATRADANCYVIAEAPLDNAEFQPNQEFTKSWTIRNNSGRTWPSSNADIRFDNGDRLHIGSDVYDLPRDIPHQGTIDILVRMRSLSSPGTYVSNWVITADGENLCRFFVKIVVK